MESKSTNDRPDSPMQLENDDTAQTTSTGATRTSISHSPMTTPRKQTQTKTSAKARNARTSGLAKEGEAAFRLSRVQKIVKMNDQAQISREAVFIMALAAEEMTRRLTRAGCEVTKTSSRQDVSLSDIANAVVASSSLSFLAEIVPQTIPLSTARSRRVTKDITSFPPDATQSMISRVQDTLRHTSRQHKLGNAPVAAVLVPGAPGGLTPSTTAPSRNYSPREARAIANSNGRQPIPPMTPMALPPGFDYRALGMPPPPPGMAYHAIDPETYRNGIRWAPVEGQTASQEGPPQGVWTDASGQFVMPPPMYAAIPNPPVAAGTTTTTTATPVAASVPAQGSRSTRRTSSSQVGSPPSNPVTTTTTAASPPASPFQPGQLQGRTIYSAGTANGATPKKKRGSRGGKKVQEGEDAMDVN